jgi:hypothetical protein
VSVVNRINREATLHRWAAGSRDDESGDYTASGFTDTPIQVDVQQQTTQENRDGRLQVVSTWTAFIRPSVDLSPQDELTVPGLGRFQFDGDPWLVTKPRTGTPHHWFARLRRVSG